MPWSIQRIGRYPLRPTRACRAGLASLFLGAALAWGSPARADASEPNDASGAPDKVQLRTADGRSFTGALIRDVPSHVLLKIGGVEARFERADVARLSRVSDDTARFSERRAALADDDFGGRLALAREMFAADQLDAARWELVLLQAALLEEAAGRDRVRALLSAVEARRVLKDEPAATGGRPAPEAANPANGSADRGGDKRPPASRSRPVYLSEADINLVRVYEIDLNDADAPGVEVPEIVLLEAITEHPKHPSIPVGEAERDALLSRSGHDQLAFLFELEARSLYRNVRIRRDPENLAAFRREINPGHVARYFEPHFGRGRVPGLKLLRHRPNTTAEAYTNFVALCRFSYQGLPMIDRFNPEASLLLQWGLPRDEALHPAPEVRGWRPRFRSLRDPRVERLREWIDGLVKFAPDYDVLLPDLGGDAGVDQEVGPPAGGISAPAPAAPVPAATSDNPPAASDRSGAASDPVRPAELPTDWPWPPVAPKADGN